VRTEYYVTRGYPIGFIAPEALGSMAGQHFLYNHVRIIVSYHQQEEGSPVYIIGFEVLPLSINHKYEKPGSSKLQTCNDWELAVYDKDNFQSVESSDEVIYTYEVQWKSSEITWTHRWDVYLKGNPDDEIHWFSIVNSLMIVLFLTGVVAMIMLRTLRRDITTYNEMQTLEEAQEESGWKLVHGDVFRPPAFSPMLLSVLAGSGVQVLAMTVCTMICALFGLLSPTNRGSFLTAMVLLYVIFGSFSGYFSARLYKLFNGKEWKRSTLLTASFYPGAIFTIYFVLNIFLSQAGSSTAVPFTTLCLLLSLWFGITTPLVFVGSYFGFKKETIEVPVRTNQIARTIPDQVWYTHPLFAVALGGILPFGAVCIELFFIMSAMWLHQFYYVFGFLFVVLLILIATCAEITIVMCYFQLCNEDYRWWWRSFLSAGSSGLYLLGYSVWYFVSKLDIQGVIPTIVYFCYMLMISVTFFLLTGSIGFWACLWFTRKIYGAIKVD
jgi:transmembrane 9 superfamily protein 2/4